MTLDLIFKDIKDPIVRENFFRLQRALLESQVLGPDFSFFEIEIPNIFTNYAVSHGLKFAPTDIFVTSVIGDQNFYFRYDMFDTTSIYVTTAGPVRIRGFIGRYAQQGKRILTPDKLPFVAPT